MEKMNKDYEEKRAKWLKENEFNEDMVTYVYFPVDSYDRKDELKELGFKFNPNLFWHIAVVPAGYEDKVIEIPFSLVAQMMQWGGSFYSCAKEIVKTKIEEKLPPAISNSEWLYEEKERFRRHKVIVKRIKPMETRYGFTQLVEFEDEDENILVWWTASNFSFDEKDEIFIDGTVKKHDEYKGIKTTVITRVKMVK